MTSICITALSDLHGTVSYGGGGGGGGGGGSSRGGRKERRDTAGDRARASQQQWNDSFNNCIDATVGTMGPSAGNPRNAEYVGQAAMACAVVATIDTIRN